MVVGIESSDPQRFDQDMFDQDDGIDSRIRVHDENQVELKLHYAIDPTARKTRYQVEAYFFVPQTLGIDRHTYAREEFFSDVHAYIRFKSPVQPLESLADATRQESPLGRVHAALASGERGPLSMALRMLGCLVRSSSRDVAKGLAGQIERLADATSGRDLVVDDVRRGLLQYGDVVTRVLGALRELRPQFIHAQRPEWLRELYEYTDEALSVFIEAHATDLVATIDRAEGVRERIAAGRQAVAALILAEQEHRRAADYITVVNGGKPDGAYVFRRGMLKKFMSSVLFLELSKEREGERIAQIVAAAAAGTAMLISTVLAIWSQEVYGVNTFPFVVALVMGYMLKDRMKDWLKSYLSTKATRWLHDFSVRISDPLTDVTVGRCRESFAFIREGLVPSVVWRRRHADASSGIETENKREVVMRYVKDITLAGRRIDRQVARASDISDIVRLDVSRFLVRMDDPKRRVPFYDAEADQVRAVKLPKRYHLNVVLVLRAGRDIVQTERFRLILDKHGIKQLVCVDQGAPAAATLAGQRVPASGLAVSVAR